MKAVGIRRGADHVRQLTVIGDGAAWIWNLAATFPQATCIVDLYHARQHLHSLTQSLEFMLGSHKEDWLAARLEDLDYGYIDGIKAAVRKYPVILQRGEGLLSQGPGHASPVVQVREPLRACRRWGTVVPSASRRSGLPDG